jgi:hypothetical protein
VPSLFSTNVLSIKFSVIAALGICVVGCSSAKLEARLEANPQCKEVINPKTGSVMPCPGTDKAFYKSVGLEQTKAAPIAASVSSEAAIAVTPNQSSQATSDCKPTLHKKTGGILPCPSPN